LARLKKKEVRNAILESAANLFMRNGYIGTTVAAIARGAGTSPSGVYVYFASKTEIAFAVFDPWMREKIENLQRDVDAQPDADARLDRLVFGLLNDIAADGSGQTLTLVQALATAKPTDEYRPNLLHWTESRLGSMLDKTWPGADTVLLKTLNRTLMLAFDGIALRQNLRQTDLDEVAEVHVLIKAVMRATS